MTTRLKVSAGVVAVAGALVLTSCSPGDLIDRAVEKGIEKGVEAATGTEIDFDDESGTVSLTTDEGEVTLGGGGGELPDGFPDEIPLIDGEIGGGMRLSEGETDGFMANVTVTGSIAEVYDNTTALLEGAGFIEIASSDMGGIRSVTYEPNGKISSLGVAFLEDDEGGVVNVSYTVSKEK